VELLAGSLIISSYVTHALVFLLLNLLLTMASSASIFEKTSSSVIFVFLNIFSASAICFSYMIHNFYDKARTGAIAGALKFMCCYFVYASSECSAGSLTVNRSKQCSQHTFLLAAFDFSEGTVKPGGSISICVLSPAAFSLGISLLSQYEAAAIGAHWDNLNVDVGGGIDLLTVMVMLVFDCFLYTFLGWYLEQVLPKEFGVRQPFWFPFKNLCLTMKGHGWSRWCLEQIAKHRRIGVGEESINGVAELDHTGENTPHTESVAPELESQAATGQCVKIMGLRRTFSTPDGEKVAVAGLNLTIYEGQIFALLGYVSTLLAVCSFCLMASADF
jgi:ATP-binding cassette subfamily A (ABC1) protein 3